MRSLRVRVRELTSTQVAAIRTAAPILWAGFATWLLNLGFDITANLADWTHLPYPVVAAGAPLILTFALWVVALLTPWSWLEALLMFVRIDAYQYEKDDELVTETGRVELENVITVDPGLAGDRDYVESTVDAILRRHVPTAVLEVAASRLNDEIGVRRGETR